MTEATQLPADDLPEVGAVYHYGGDNYAVTRVDPGSFICLGDDEEWTDAIAFTDHVAEGETATITYVMPLDLFVESYELGIIDETAPGEDGGGEQAETRPGEGGSGTLHPATRPGEGGSGTQQPAEPEDSQPEPKGT
jgi:hypothetical protein